MFDGLKDKLGSFREEAEEAAEANAEPVEEDEAEDLDGADSDVAGDVADSDAADEVAGSDTADAKPGAGADVPAAADAAAGEDATTDAESAADAEADSAAEADVPAADGADAAAADEADPAAQAGDESDAAARDAGSESDDAARDDSDAVGDSETADDSDVADGPTIVYPGADDEGEDDVDTDDAEGAGEAAGDVETDEEDDSSTSFTKKARSFTRGKFVIEEEDLEGPLQDLEMALLAGDVEMEVAQELTERIREELVGETRTFTTGTGEVVEDALRSALLDVVSVGQFDFDQRIAEAEKPVVVVFTGVNGVGKTTSIAKLARYLEDRGHDSVMANGDTFRAGANEQIEEHAENLDTKLITHEQGGDPAAVIYDGVEYAEAHDVDVVLGDTAGRLHTSEGLMDQLAKIDRVVDPDVTLFVDEAVAGQDAVNRAREFDDAAEIDGSILTKADADSSGGAAISIAQVTGKPILFLGTGQGYEDIERFDPEWLVDQLLEE